jgi:hypothetical protein
MADQPKKNQPPEPSAFERFVQSARRAVGGGPGETPAAKPESGPPDPAQVDRMTGEMKRAWNIGQDGKVPPAAKEPASALDQFTARANNTVRPDGAIAAGVSRSTGWVAARVKDTLQDFVGRVLYGETTSPPPSDEHEKHDKDRGIDR